MSNQKITVALAGNPNSGKTTLFNELTGSSQHVGNWPGVTVEKKNGKLRGSKDVEIIDLPGVYSLSPYTPEEVVARDFLLNERPDIIINIVDSTNIERNLYLTSQLIDTGIPVIVALNMSDLADKQGISLDVAAMEEKLNCRMIKISAVKNKGVQNLIKETIDISQDGIREAKQSLIDEAYGNLNEEAEENAVERRYSYVETITENNVVRSMDGKELTSSDKIDVIVTNKWLALPIFFALMWIVYYVSIVTVGDWTIGWVETLFGFIGTGAESLMTSAGAGDVVIDLVVNGIIGSMGAIFVFVPQLMILFFFLSLLEDSGYMARVAFIMDKIFRNFGLSGKSFIPMLIGTGCSVPGIMASRTIESQNDRNMTVMLTPFIPCGAKLPVFAMFIAMMFRGHAWVGPSMYIIGICMVIISGIILKKTRLFSGDPSPFVMEMPDYKIPGIKGVAIHMWEKGWSFIKKAGTVIFAACVTLWFLQNFSFTGYVGPEAVSESILAQIGNAIRYIFVPLGFGDSWSAPVAAVTGLIAKEVVVATFASVGSAVPIVFSQVTAFAFMIFTLFAAPCAAAIGAMKREFGSWKLTGFAVLFQTGIAYILAALVNLIGGVILKGTSATQSVTLDISIMESASEGDVTNVNIVLVVFAALMVIGFAIGLINKFGSSRKYEDLETANIK